MIEPSKIDIGSFKPSTQRRSNSSAAATNIVPLLGLALPDLRAPLNPQAISRQEFKTEYEGTFSKFELRPGIYGRYEVRFTLKGGMNSLNLAFNELDQAMKNTRNCPYGFDLRLSENSYINFPLTEDIVIIYTPVIRLSENRVRLGSDPETSHHALLDSLGLEPVPNDIARFGAAAMRIAKGFPEHAGHIGSGILLDHADLNEGMTVRTAKGNRSGLVHTWPTGIKTHDWKDDIARKELVVAGMSYRSYEIINPEAKE